MPIPAAHRNRHVYHFTCLENLPGILEHGLLCMTEKRRIQQTHRSVAAQSIQERRSQMVVTCGPGGCVHDYVPFYFCSRSSMLLAVVNAKNVDQQLLIYFAYPIALVERDDVVFTDASANTGEPPNFYSNPSDLTHLNWGAIDSLKWKLTSDAEKQARMAEVLIHQRVDVSQPSYIVVWNQHIRNRVCKAYEQKGLAVPEIVYDGHDRKYFYFTKYPSATQESLVTGPAVTASRFKAIWTAIKKAIADDREWRFANPAEALQSLRNDMTCIPEVAEIVGLGTDNAVHQDDVGVHTQKVVRQLRGSAEFKQLSQGDQEVVELAAYLHDIGKGPKSRWSDNGGKQKVDPDHPIRSMEMMERILTEDIGGLKLARAKRLLKLVCYHELVGDIVAKGRDEEQLDAICKSARDLDSLIALGKADMAAINPLWKMMYGQKIAQLRDCVCQRLGFGERRLNDSA